MIKYGLNGATTMPLDQETEIRLAGAAGFDVIELRVPKVEQYLKFGTLSQLKGLLSTNGLKILSVNAIERVNTRESGKESELLAESRKVARWAQALECPFIIAVPGFLQTPRPQAEIVDETVDVLVALSEAVASYNVRLAFEFLGFANCSVNSLRMAKTIVDRVGGFHVGLVIDTFHFFLSGEPLEELAEIQTGELVLFHVNDAEDLPPSALGDQHRLLPGMGVIPLRKMWDALRQRGLVDHASIELFRPEYWALPPADLLRNALDSMRTIFC